jgi:indole-3-glycerol phosphate synthase
MNILEKIVLEKRKEIAARKREIPMAQLVQNPFFKEPSFSLRKALKAKGSSGIIAEHKRKSPSLGWIKADSNAAQTALAYAQNGAAAISCLTDSDFFGGDLSDLRAVRAALQIPVLRKDFTVDEYQIFEAKAFGADAILLISECLSAQEVKTLAQCAQNLGLEVLYEMHDADGLEKLCDAITCVGINNRNLKTFEVSVQTSIDLSSQIPDRFVKVAESGISKPDLLPMLRQHGFEGFLIGEVFMKSENPGLALKNFLEMVQKIEI